MQAECVARPTVSVGKEAFGGFVEDRMGFPLVIQSFARQCLVVFTGFKQARHVQ
jgi:hypothetical protein